MSEFSTHAELSIEVPSREIKSVVDQLESELSNIPVGLDASAASTAGSPALQPRNPESGRFEAVEGVEQRLLDQQVVLETVSNRAQTRNDHLETAVEHLDEIEDAIEGGALGGGGGRGGGGGGLFGILGGGGRLAGGTAGAAAGGSLGATALGVGAGVGAAGIGVGAAGLGVGAGVGLAKGTTDLPDEFVIQGPELSLAENFNPTFEPTFDFNPEFTPEMFNIDTRVDIGANAFRFDPMFGPENFDFRPTIGDDAIQLGPERFESPRIEVGDITIDPRIDLNASLNFNPSIEVTGIDFGGRGGQLADAVVSSRTFQNELDSKLSNVEDDIVSRIAKELGIRGL